MAIAVRPEDHKPVYVLAPDKRMPNRKGWAIGCSCGAKPATLSLRISMRLVWFQAHVKKLGLPRIMRLGQDPYGSAVYAEGPAKGLTWEQARSQGIDTNGEAA